MVVVYRGTVLMPKKTGKVENTKKKKQGEFYLDRSVGTMFL